MKLSNATGLLGRCSGRWLRTLVLIGTGLAITLPASARGRFIVRPGIAFGSPFGYYGYGPYNYGYGYGYGLGYGGYPMFSRPTTGTIKFDKRVKDAQVFINGGYVGTEGELKSFHLKAGSYNLEVRAPGRPNFAERIYVVNGKTLHVHPES